MSELRAFEVNVTDAALADLDARLAATRWIDDVFEGDWACGAPLLFAQALCAHWRETFDWRALEARINTETNVTTQIDGLTIHALHRRSERADAVPLLMLHGWPSGFVEFLDLLDPLSAPGKGEPAFHVITPSLPGYGFSTTKPGMTPQRCAAVIAELMARLGYERYMVQGGDWGFLVGTEIARQFPQHVIGLHLNLLNGSPPPDAETIPLTEEEQEWIADFGQFVNYTHFVLNSQTPASASHAFNDSPAGLAAWIGEKLHDWTDNRARPEGALSFDQMLRIIALYWFTGTIGSSARLYYEMVRDLPEERYVTVPTAGAIFPEEVVKLPRAWADRLFNIVQYTVYERGGHFPAMEEPEVLIADIRRFAKLLSAG